MSEYDQEQLKISACLMVKNEEEMLPACLESIKDIADEIIVVDTGSTDRTVEIAESYGAQVYHHPWENNFSKHRNQSISYATGDWFFTIDADERLESDTLSKQKLKARLRDLSDGVHAVLVTMKDYTREGKLKLVWKVSKLFRNNAGVHFEGEVHNQAVTEGKTTDSSLVIRHYGYDLSPEKMEKKYERTHSLLRNRIQDNPDDYEAYFYLANLYGGYKEYENCIEAGEKMLELLPPDEKGEIFLKIYYNIGAAYANLHKYDEAKQWCFEGLEVLPDDVDLHYLLINIGVLTKDIALIREHARLFLQHFQELEEENVRAGLRFIYHLAETHKNNATAHLMAALISEKVNGSVNDLAPRYQSALDNNPSIALKFLEDLAAMELDQQLLQQTFLLLERNPQHEELLDPLMKRSSEQPELPGEFITRLKSSGFRDNTQLFSVSMNKLLEFGRITETEDMLEYGLSLGMPPEVRVAKQSILAVRKGDHEEALRYIKQGLALQVDDKQFYLDAILALYQYNESHLLREAIERALLYYDSFENIPDYVLLLLSHRLYREQEIDYLLDVTTALCRQFDITASGDIDSWGDFADIYHQCAEHLVSQEKYHTAQMAWKTGFLMTQNGRYLARIGKSYYEKGNYEKALSCYTDALEYNYHSPEMIGQMKKIFAEINDSAGLAQCEQLLTVY